jgi:hypothetical protein
MKRRKFILLSALGISGISISLTLWRKHLYFDLKHQIARPRLLMRLCDLKTIHMLGAAYLKENRFEHNINVLLNTLGYTASVENQGESHKILLADVDEQILLDFESNHIVILKGWILSITEARQCALLSIIDR